MKKISFSLFFIPLILIFNVAIAADNARSDTLDILDYNIHLNITDFANKTINGFTIITFKSKLNNISELDLDLLALQIDSITQNNQQLSFTYNDELIKINLTSSLNTGDSSGVTVYYHGSPQGDASGWGGWYWSGDYSFNLGVGFAAIPHTYGRVWFPCFDNFVERSTYHFTIITASDKMALCNGGLISSVDNGNGTKTWNWEMLNVIPSYLACVAVGKYEPAYQTYNGMLGAIPIQLGAIATDTTKMKNSFIHLPDALDAFETSWGPFRWNKVGYSLVPFSSGAMEHATNIAYPLFAANGNTTYENLFVHELSHHWFGDLVTCRTAEDMWLNEGWAVYCEHIFTEHVYGKQAYDDAIAANHEYSVHYAHTPLADGQYFPVSGVPQDYTYGTTVYDKGADIAHTLRGYMGDSLFFECITHYLADNQFTDQSSEDFRDYLSSCSGMDLNDFFDNWVFSPGWAAFTIDSTSIVSDGADFNVEVFLRQRLDHTPSYYNNVPLEISFYDSAWNSITLTCPMSGACNSFTTALTFSPVFVGLDLASKISDAVTADLKTLKTTSTISFTNGKMTVAVASVSDSALVRIEHVYAAPDPLKNPVTNLHISQERFWKVDGIFPSGFDASGSITYNGTASSGGYLDNQLLTNTEDSIEILYRSSIAADWKIITDVIRNYQGSHTDKRGAITISHLQKGEYALGMYQHDKIDSMLSAGGDSCLLLSVHPVFSGGKETLSVFPNPSDNSITVEFMDASPNNLLEIFNLYGQQVYHAGFNKTQQVISVKNWNRGIYLAQISDGQHQVVATQKIVIN